MADAGCPKRAELCVDVPEAVRLRPVSRHRSPPVQRGTAAAGCARCATVSVRRSRRRQRRRSSCLGPDGRRRPRTRRAWSRRAWTAGAEARSLWGLCRAAWRTPVGMAAASPLRGARLALNARRRPRASGGRDGGAGVAWRNFSKTSLKLEGCIELQEHTTRGAQGHLMLGEHIVPQSEVIRAILSEDSPCCRVAHREVSAMVSSSRFMVWCQ